jgi:tRNA pseudouridine55 synthase
MNSDLVRIVEKEIGQTPLEVLEQVRAQHPEYKNEPMTYAGRLDPMASGKLIILIGEECKNKDQYTGLDKEYDVEILFGIKTDSYDVLGIPRLENPRSINSSHIDWSGYIGKHDQEYPPYSSKTINGKQLHALARANELPQEIPTKNVEIYSIEIISESEIKSSDLLKRIISNVTLVKGDFRQKQIIDAWTELLQGKSYLFSVIKIKVKCSSGTYMRSLANKIGQDLGTAALALSITRTKIGNKKNP